MHKPVLLFIAFLALSNALWADPDPKQWLAKQQVSFTENKGQIADKGKTRKDIFFIAQSKGVKIYFTRTGLIYNYIQTEETFFKKPDSETEKEKIRKEHPEQVHRKSKAYGMELLFVNASEKVIIKSEEETGETSNYYLPQCPDGITNVKSYRKITYQNLYPNIDLVFYSSEQGMKYDFIVKPGGNIADIQLKYKDVQHLKLLKDGSLEIKNPLGTLTEGKPFTYQNDKQEIKSNYKVKGRTLSFEVNNYDKTKNLTIDPSIIWATYYGGTEADYGYNVKTDKSGNMYLSGRTISTAYIAMGGFQNNLNTDYYSDAFLVKFNSFGQRLWATYYGGENEDSGKALALDDTGNIYMAGFTASTTKIASGGFQNTYGGGIYDAFLVKFTSSGQRLWASYYGGVGREYGNDILIDPNGNVYLAGETSSTTDIASGGFQNTYGGGFNDGFIVKFSSSGQRLWGSYYGGSITDVGTALSVDASGYIYLAGDTFSPAGIASQGFQNMIAGETDSFLVKFNTSGQRIWGTYFGGVASESTNDLTIDNLGNLFLVGQTTLNPASNIGFGGFQNTFGGGLSDAFIVKFSSSGQRLWASYYGGSGEESGSGITTDKAGNLILTGFTSSLSNIASGGFQNTYSGGDYDAFLVKFSSSGQRLWSSYYGGSGIDYGIAAIVDKVGDIYTIINTNSLGMGLNGFQNTSGGNFDAFIAKISDLVPLNNISGQIYLDVNGNCIREAGEKPMPNIIVKAEPEGFGISDSLGNYSIPIGLGTYTIKQKLPPNSGQKIISQGCPAIDYSIDFSTYGNTITGKDFGNRGDLCSYLDIKVSSNQRRRCFLNNTNVIYSNFGFAKAENVKVYVKMPDNVLLKKADKAFTIDKNGNYVFNIGTLDVNQFGGIQISDSVVCKAGITGLTACTKAWITPANNCTPPKSTWDKSDIVLSGKCIDNGFVRMVFKNMGEGNMADSSQLRILLDAQLALKKGFKINKGDSLVVKIPANGRTVRLEADERPDHPRKSQTSITFEGCTSSIADVVSKGFVNQLPQDDTEPEVSIQCLPIRDSYDPNDKQVLPTGTTIQHFTPTDAELQYQIRFQNTGTDTAYTVTVIDTLSDNLDIATLQIGAASHKYQFNVSGKGKPVLTWTFNNINLPDSTKDKLKSNGFISFSIKAKTGLVAQTKIENYADIIFDFNDPVRTNTTFNVMYDVPPVVQAAVKLDEKTVFYPKPVIAGFSPAGNFNGQQVTLTGSNFEAKPTDNIVKVNGLSAQVVSGSTTQLIITVPQGATTGRISVTTSGGTATSEKDFITSPLAAENPLENQISVYPNPTDGVFTVAFATLKAEEITVFNAMGQKIFSRTPVSKLQEINLQHQSAGLYLINIRTSSGIIIKKLIIK